MQVVGDDLQPGVVQQLLGNGFVGGADIDKQGGVVRNVLSHQFGDAVLFRRLLEFALGILGILGAGRCAGTTVKAANPVFSSQ